MAEHLTPGIQSFYESFQIERIAAIRRVDYDTALLTPSDRAYFLLLGEAKQAIYSHHIERLNSKAAQ